MINWLTFYKVDLKKTLHSAVVDDSSGFTLQLNKPELHGWYMLEALVDSKRQVSALSLEFDFGGGFTLRGSKSLLARNRKIYKRIIYLNPNAKKMRLSASSEDCLKTIKKLRLVKITGQFAYNRMCKRLGFVEQDHSLSKTWKLYNKHFENIYSSQYLVGLEPSYTNWITRIEKPSLPSAFIINAAIARWKLKPLVSIILPTYNTPPVYLEACINSVINQSYTNWELCIADDNSTSLSTKKIIETYRRKYENKIKVVFREENGHISACSNSALEVSAGDYIAFLDHDDMLTKDALYFVVECINNDASAKIIYSDEDWIDEENNRITPHFKSDWNPDLFLSHNYITHFSVFDSLLIKKVAGLRLGVEGSQDYDLILRCLPYISSNQIRHIPRVLYHWRAVEGSTALDAGEKSYTVEAGKKSLQNYFESVSKSKVIVEPLDIDNTYRVRWPIPHSQPSVTLIIPTRDMKDVLQVAVTSILEKTDYKNYQILIIDNNSKEPETLKYFEALRKQEERISILEYKGEFNYSAINNFAVKKSQSDIVGLINNDIEVINSDWLTEMVSHACRPEIGCVGAKLYYADDTIQHAGIIMGLGGAAAHSHRHFPREHPGYIGRLKMVQNLSGVTAACLLVRREVYDEVKGLDAINLKVAYNDVDFCLKVKQAGYRNLWTPFAELYHYESLSRGYEDSPEKKKRFAKETRYLVNKWSGHINHDPFYNPNLTADHENFSIRVT